MTIREHLEAIRVELVCAYHSPDARSREPDIGAAHRAVCAALVQLDESETARRHSGETYRLVPDMVEVSS